MEGFLLNSLVIFMLMTSSTYAGIDFTGKSNEAMVVDITIPEFYSLREAEIWAHTFEGVDPIRRKLRDYILAEKSKAGVLTQEDVLYPQRIINYGKKISKIALYEAAYEIMLEAKERVGASCYGGSIPLNRGIIYAK